MTQRSGSYTNHRLTREGAWSGAYLRRPRERCGSRRRDGGGFHHPPRSHRPRHAQPRRTPHCPARPNLTHTTVRRAELLLHSSRGRLQAREPGCPLQDRGLCRCRIVGEEPVGQPRAVADVSKHQQRMALRTSRWLRPARSVATARSTTARSLLGSRSPGTTTTGPRTGARAAAPASASARAANGSSTKPVSRTGPQCSTVSGDDRPAGRCSPSDRAPSGSSILSGGTQAKSSRGRTRCR